MKKRLLSALLALCMGITLFPTAALASAEYAGGGIYFQVPDTPSAFEEENDIAQSIEVSNAADFITAAKNADGGTYEIVLTANIELPEPVEFAKGRITISGRGHVISAAASFSGDSLIIAGNDANLILNNCTLDGGNLCRGLLIGSDTPSSNYSSALVTMVDSTIQNGSAENGGGVYLSGYKMGRGYFSAALIMNSSKITNCTASGSGGGVYFSSPKSALTMSDNSSIDGCSAVNGGGVYLDWNSTLTMNTGSRIENCSATQDGGGAYLNGSQSKLTMNGDSTIDSCSAQNGGGACLNGSSANLTMNSSSIAKCTAVQNGGGVYLSGSNACLTPDMSGSITGCRTTSGNGGGIYCGSQSFINLNNGAGITVTDCDAGISGGGLFFAPNAASHDLSDCVIYNNTAVTAGADIYLSTGNYYYNLPDYSRSDLVHKTDSNRITGWYPDNAGSRYQHSPYTASVLGSSYTLSVTDTPIGLVACSTLYKIEFNVSDPDQYHAYSDQACTNVITEAAPGECVYLKYDGNSDADADCRMSLSVTTDGNSSVPVLYEGDTAYFVMPAVNIKEKAIVSFALEYKITVIGGYAGLMSKPTTAITYAAPDSTFCLRFNGSGTFEKWVWDAVNRPDDLTDGDSRNTNPNFPRFTMPEHAVTVWATTKGDFYQIYVEPPEDTEFTKSPVTVTVTENTPAAYAEPVRYDSVTSANAGQTVQLTFDPGSLPADCEKSFGQWVVTQKTDNTAVTVTSSASQTSAVFTMPASDVLVTFALNGTGEPDTPDTPSGGSDGGASAIVIGTLIGGATYLVGTDIWLHGLFGFIPENRIQLALALWNRADCPAPESAELYPDIDEDDDDAQQAARWCVEQELMKDYHKTDKDGNEEVTFKPYRYVFRPQAIKAWYDLEQLLNEQQPSAITASESDSTK